jgi:small-conductance mechanosensitive channel
VFGWLLAFALAIGPIASLVNWSVSYDIATRGCGNPGTSIALPIFSPGHTDDAGIVLIALTLAVAGLFCAINAWRSLRMQSPGIEPSLATDQWPKWFLPICAWAGCLLFIVAVLVNAIALAVLPACM